MSKYKFFKEEVIGLRNQVTFIGDKLEIYLPENYLKEDSVFGTIMGDMIETLGLFMYKVDGKVYKLLYPIKMKFRYSEESSFTGKLTNDLPSMKYDVFVLHNGDAFCYDTSHSKDVTDVETVLLKIIDEGKVPNILKYGESILVYLNLLVSSGYKTSLGTSSAIIEILLSEIYRNKHNPSEPFRKLITNSKNASEYDYKEVKLTRLTGMNSIFNSLLGENTSNQMTNIIVRQREHKRDRESPLEKLLKY